MTFLNWSMLFGLLALALPVAIHLLHRRKPRAMDWAAMQFLLASLTYRSRRILLEELVLLVLRCLTLALLVLALARPFLPVRSSVPWVLILPALLAAAIGVGLAAALWNQTALRRRLLLAVAVLALVGLGGAAYEGRRQRQWWSSDTGGRDVALVLDASLSMTVTVDGDTNFRRAAAEACTVVDAGRTGDAFSVILAGPTPQTLVREPTPDRPELRRVLQGPDCRPLGGSLAVLEALDAAGLALASGANPAKTIILFTDGQNAGWDLRNDTRWRSVADSFRRFATPPKVIVRRLPGPAAFRNVAVAGLAPSRRVIGIDRPVAVDVQVLNAGTTPIQPDSVSLFVDDAPTERQPSLQELLPNITKIVRFTHLFAQPGRHTLRVVVEADDDLRDDNTLEQTVDVLDRLPLLIVDGAPGERGLRRASAFLRLALAPTAAEPRRDGTAGTPPADLVEAAVTSPADLPDAAALDAFRVVILANVARLPGAAADRLAAFVKKGGGLLVAPGARAEPDFYNTWRSAAGERLTPALLRDRVHPPEPVRVEPRSFAHPALRQTADSRLADLAQGAVTTYWKLVVDGRDPAVRVAARLDQGDPLIVERQYGRGHILATALALDGRDSTLPSLAAFVPFAHELVYYLATPSNPGASAVRQPEESTITALTEADLADVRTHLDSFVADTRAQLLTAFGGDAPGRELWRVLALCAILTLLAEIALARWIAVKRRRHGAEAVKQERLP